MSRGIDGDALIELIDMRIRAIEEYMKNMDNITKSVIRNTSIRELNHVKKIIKKSLEINK